MKYILIILILIAYGCYFGVILIKPFEIKDILGSIFLIAVSVVCSRYLYKKENTNKVEWALFGFLGNVSAVFYHWIYRLFTDHWKKGKTVTGDN